MEGVYSHNCENLNKLLFINKSCWCLVALKRLGFNINSENYFYNMFINNFYECVRKTLQSWIVCIYLCKDGNFQIILLTELPLEKFVDDYTIITMLLAKWYMPAVICQLLYSCNWWSMEKCWQFVEISKQTLPFVCFIKQK